MRNLKRALSLTLASVMLLGMMVIGTSAASYPDVDKDNNVEAIEVLQAVGVMQGDDKGNFDPDRTVSRNEMAIVMAKLLNLDYNYYSESCPFWDVPDYAKPYVGACYANGIVSGYNATQYGGADTVTAVQAASMMMRALGYFKYDSDYKDGFVIATVRQASKIGLFADINAGQDTPLTRDQVAQLALNTLETAIVDAEDNTLNISGSSGGMSMSVTGGQVNYVVRTSTEKFAKAINDTDFGNNNTDGRQGCTVELGEQLYNGDLKRDDDTDDFERPATRWTYKFSEIGKYADTPDYTYTTSISGDTPADKVKTMGLKGYTWNGVYYENGASASCAGSDSAERLGKLAADVAADGVLIEVFMDDDNTDTIERVTVIRTQMMQVNAVSSKEVTLKKLDDNKRDNGDTVKLGNHTDFITVKTVKEDDAGFSVLKDLHTDDYVLVVPVLDGSQYKVASVVVPETITGVLESINTKSTDKKVKSIRVNGETYKMSNTWTSEDDEMHKDTKLSSKQECQVYLDTYGNAIYVKDVEANNSAIIVDYIYSAVENGKIVKYAEGWDSTGNQITLNLGTSPNLYGDESAAQGKVFEYKTSNVNDADYELIQPKLTWASNDTNIVYGYSTDGSAAAKQTISYGQYTGEIGQRDSAKTNLPFDSSVKFIFISKEGADVTGITVKTGVSEVKCSDNEGAALTYILNDRRDKIVAVVVPNDDDAGNSASLLYLEAITSHSNNSNGKRVAYATIWIDGEQIKDVELNKDYGTNDVDKFYTYSESNGVYTLTPYTRNNKVSSVACGQVLDRAKLSDMQDYWFQGVSTTLNGRDAKVFDLYSDDGKFYDSVKGMQDAIKNGDVSEKTNSPITNFKVSYIYNGDSGDSGYNTVKYIFITKTNDGGGSGSGIGGGTENKTDIVTAPGGMKVDVTTNENGSSTITVSGTGIDATVPADKKAEFSSLFGSQLVDPDTGRVSPGLGIMTVDVLANVEEAAYYRIVQTNAALPEAYPGDFSNNEKVKTYSVAELSDGLSFFLGEGKGNVTLTVTPVMGRDDATHTGKTIIITVKNNGVTYKVPSDVGSGQDLVNALGAQGVNKIDVVGNVVLNSSGEATEFNKPITVSKDSTLTVKGNGAAIKETVTVTGTMKAEGVITTSGGGKIVLDGGTLELSADRQKLPKVEGNGVIVVHNNKQVGTNATGAPTVEEYLDDLKANLKVNEIEGKRNGNSITFEVSDTNIVGVKGEGKIESWSSALTIAEMAARCGGDKNSKVIFIEIAVPAGTYSAGEKVKVEYTEGDGEVKPYNPTENKAAEWTMSAKATNIIIPVTDDVTSVILTKVPTAGGSSADEG